MANASGYAGGSDASTERRGQVRHPLNALAYIDIGADNGGIVLNLSEDGMGFQAVGPLDSQQDVNLRIQLPHSTERIETAAKIVWLSESNRQAGVRFLEMPAEARAEIRGWIRSQNSNGDLLTETLAQPEILQPEVLKAPPPKTGPIHKKPNDKWLSLMADLETPPPQPKDLPQPKELPPEPLKGAPRFSDADSDRCTITLQELSARLNATENASRHFAQRAQSAYGNPLRRSVPREPALYQRGPELTKAGAIEESNGQTDRVPAEIEMAGADMLPASLVFAVPSTALAPVPSVPSVTDTEPSATVPNTKSYKPETTGTSWVPIGAPPAKSPALKWMAAAVAVVFFSLLCFAVGTWVGSLGIPAPSVQTSASANVASSAQSDASETGSAAASGSSLKSDGRDVKEGAAAKVGKKGSERVVSNPAGHKLGRSANSPNVVPVSQNLPLPSSQYSAPPLVTQTAQDLTPKAQVLAPTGPISYNAPAVQQPTPTKPPVMEVASAPQPTPSDYAPDASPPSIVAGRVLRPTDRFNPCHLIYRVEPVYPDTAKKNGIEGVVKIHETVRTDGTVRSIKVVSGPKPLALAALDAAQYWRYMPALLNGQPIETDQDIEITFRLPK